MGRGEAFVTFFHTYGATPRELQARGLRAREVLELVAHMPAGTPKWTQGHEVAASVVDQLEMLRYALLAINTDRKDRGKIAQPQKFPRPGAKPKPVSRLRGEAFIKPSRSFKTAAEFDAWRASRLKPRPA